MHRRMAAGTPARAAAQQRRVRRFTNENFTADRVDLGMALEAKIVVPLHQHFVGD